MTSFRKSERILLGLGTLIFISSLSLYLFQADRLSVLFGAQATGSPEPVGRINYKKNMARRRLQDGNEFLPAQEQQTIYSNDTVMTGSDSQLILTLNDGSKLELGPDTLVEIKFRDADGGFGQNEFVVDVKKGHVKANVLAGKVSMVQNGGAEQILTPTTPSQPRIVIPETAPASTNPLAGTPGGQNIAMANRAPQALAQGFDNHCSVLGTSVHSVSKSKNRNFLPTVDIDVGCQQAVDNQEITVANGSGEVVFKRTFSTDMNGRKRFNFEAKDAGAYTVTIRSSNQNPPSIDVPQEYKDLSFSNPVFDCNQNLYFQAPDSMKNMHGMLRLLDAKNNSVLSEKQWDGNPFLEASPEKSVAPKSLALVFELENHYRLVSKTIDVKGWRVCAIQTKYPVNHSDMSLADAKKTIFTWSLEQGETYTFRLSRDAEFSDVIRTEDTKLNFIEIDIDSPGKYFWDVKAGNGHSSEVSDFEVH